MFWRFWSTMSLAHLLQHPRPSPSFQLPACRPLSTITHHFVKLRFFYQHAPRSSFSTVSFRDSVAVAAAVTRCRSLRLQHIDQQCSALRARIRILEARRAQQRRHGQQRHLIAGVSSGTEETDDSDSSSSGSDSSSNNSDDGRSGWHSDPDNYYKELARYTGLPHNIFDAADWTEDDD